MANIQFDQLKIESVNTSAGVFSGKNLQVNWKSVSKSNQGYGEMAGDHNSISKGQHVVFDPDLIDQLRKKKKK